MSWENMLKREVKEYVVFDIQDEHGGGFPEYIDAYDFRFGLEGSTFYKDFMNDLKENKKNGVIDSYTFKRVRKSFDKDAKEVYLIKIMGKEYADGWGVFTSQKNKYLLTNDDILNLRKGSD